MPKRARKQRRAKTNPDTRPKSDGMAAKSKLSISHESIASEHVRERDAFVDEIAVGHEKAAGSCPVPAERVVDPLPITVAETAVVAPGRWLSLSQSVVGRAHLRQKPIVPCQDATAASTRSRPIAVVADGAGSSVLSHLGSECLANGILRFVESIDPVIALVVDRPSTIAESDGQLFTINAMSTMVARHAVGLLSDLADAHKRTIDDFRSTLLLVVAGSFRCFWIKVGDGLIFSFGVNGTKILGPSGKGEYANQTNFIGSSFEEKRHLTFGLVDMSGITGFLLCTDGAGDKLASTDGTRVAGAVGGMINDLSRGALTSEDLFDFLVDKENWRGVAPDDRSIAILSAKT